VPILEVLSSFRVVLCDRWAAVSSYQKHNQLASDKMKGSAHRKGSARQTSKSKAQSSASRGRRSTKPSPEPAAEGLRHGWRAHVFGALVFCVAALGLWLSISALSNRQTDSSVSLTTRSVLYTVHLRDVASDEMETADRFIRMEPIQSLADGNEFFFEGPRQGKTRRLCVGKFPSEDSPQLRELFTRFRQFTVQGRKAFPDISIHQCRDGGSVDRL